MKGYPLREIELLTEVINEQNRKTEAALNEAKGKTVLHNTDHGQIGQF